MQTAELTGTQREIVLGKIESQVGRLTKTQLSELQKLHAIGSIVKSEITSVLAERYAESTPRVEPSILPQHDDATIGHLARYQATLRNSGLPAAVQAQLLDRMEHSELQMQRDDRAPQKLTYFDLTDDEQHTSYHFDN